MPVYSAARVFSKKGTVPILVLTASLLSQLLLLKSLAYSRASLSNLSMSEAAGTADPLALGDLRWHPEPYVNAASLEPIRTEARKHCPGLTGYAAARCLANLFATRFRHGNPKHEFVDRDHDPVAVWRAHLSGQPGHCVTRSGLLALALLATGTSARVVQLIPRNGDRGHNVTEVWDPATGWRILDPSYGGRFEAADGQPSAMGLVSPPYPRWQRDRSLVQVAGIDPYEGNDEYGLERLRAANLIYPEPWLYTRVGKRQAAWPFAAQFLMVGPQTLSLGLGHSLLHGGILFSVAGLVVLGVRLAMSARRKATRAAEASAAVAEPQAS